MTRFSRRTALRLGAGLLSLLVLPGGVLRAFAREDARNVVAAFTKGQAPKEGGIVLDILRMADNANAVPARIVVDTPMTAESYCAEVMLVAEKNPRPVVCRFEFSPGPGVAEVSTRIRLAESQDVVALARMSDGSVRIANAPVVVTMGGCG